MRILLDPGHGGLQLGHVGPNSQEKDLTLELAIQTARCLGSSHQVALTRVNDVDVSHRERREMASCHDLTVSLHFHAVGNPYLRRLEGGARIAEGEALARLLLEHVARAVGEPHVYRPTQTRITSQTKKPVCVLMLGYLSHPETEAALLSGERLQVTAEALASGLLVHAGIRS